jgi:hypothetical protein
MAMHELAKRLFGAAPGVIANQILVGSVRPATIIRRRNQNRTIIIHVATLPFEVAQPRLKPFAGEFRRRVDAEFAPDSDFAGGVVEHIPRAFGEKSRSACAEASADRRIASLPCRSQPEAGRCWRKGG